MAEISAVSFSALPQAGDGYTVLYENNQVCRSEKKLSELVGEKTNSFLTKEQGDSLYQEKGNYLIDDDITGKLDKSQYAVDSATFLTAHQDISNKLDTTAFSTVSGDFLTEHQNLDDYAKKEWVNNQGFLKEHQPISANEWNDVYETVVANSGTWGTETNWTDDINEASANAYNSAINWVENQNYITGVDLTDYYTKEEVDEEISKIGSYVVVNETTGEDKHPVVENPSTKEIYLTKQTEGKLDNYNEWIGQTDSNGNRIEKSFKAIGDLIKKHNGIYIKVDGKDACSKLIDEIIKGIE